MGGGGGLLYVMYDIKQCGKSKLEMLSRELLLSLNTNIVYWYKIDQYLSCAFCEYINTNLLLNRAHEIMSKIIYYIIKENTSI